MPITETKDGFQITSPEYGQIDSLHYLIKDGKSIARILKEIKLEYRSLIINKIKITSRKSLYNTDDLLPIHVAARYNNLTALKELIEAGAELIVYTTDGRTPLHLAAIYNAIDVLEYLLNEKKFPVDTPNLKGGATALYDAVSSLNRHCITVLLKAGAKLDFPCAEGATALHLICKYGFHWNNYELVMDTINLLLQEGANPALRNNAKTAVEMIDDPVNRSKVQDLIDTHNKKQSTTSRLVANLIDEKKSQTDEHMPVYTDVCYLSRTICAFNAYLIDASNIQKLFVEIWDIEKQKKLSTLAVLSASYDAYDKILVAATSDDRIITVTNTKIYEWTNLYSTHPDKKEISRVNPAYTFTTIQLVNNNTLLTTNIHGQLISWDLKNGNPNLIAEFGSSNSIQHLHLPDNGTFVTLCQGTSRDIQSALIYNPTLNDILIRRFDITNAKIHRPQSSVLLKNNKLAILTSHSARGKPNIISIYDICNDGTMIKDIIPQYPATSITVSENGYLVCAEEKGFIEIFDNETFKRLGIFQIPNQSNNLIFWNPWNVDEFLMIENGKLPVVMNLCLNEKISQNLHEAAQLSPGPASVVLSYLFKPKTNSCAKEEDDQQLNSVLKYIKNNLKRK